MIEHNQGLVEEDMMKKYDEEFKSGSDKKYPSIELVRLEQWFFDSCPGTVIEYGFGSGVNTKFLLEKNYRVYGIDASKEAKKAALKKLKSFRSSDFELDILNINSKSLPYENEKFDYAVIMSVISLLGSINRIKMLLSEINRVLKKNGKLIIDVNSSKSLFTNQTQKVSEHIFQKKDKERELQFYCPEHIDHFIDLINNFFTIKDVGRMLSHIMGRRTEEFILCAQKK
tara:strand:- start:3801 stop:4484 length:684 start_codon:yes stop_codon:yes gene_type:complete